MLDDAKRRINRDSDDELFGAVFNHILDFLKRETEREREAQLVRVDVRRRQMGKWMKRREKMPTQFDRHNGNETITRTRSIFSVLYEYFHCVLCRAACAVR